ncbi:precorrin-2 dehydrogenase/sirohydrochlorin ferrochelatase family protein [Methanopyrus kandleri]|uniref:precorrin-2 dehydrogenase n=2 Tax=Methanopyrus kandleri TaxID=2320 RepID=Q8TV97_METKA|nr:bifunctional precorrin-2 dehydrogenase/sirohydrochlorin ferrochelatase [Methanopyrus kandleri]AAM02708.1 Siroheme synthase (precorrin-2 oxidase/ferrochelatase domain) [Methanopyrus kandleri AV19]HII70965.1 bifunctional precorrin-2 dehydrogenase/sirohydrochlorin ferrochelatase [Methanopyrus kandleri]
MPYVPLFVRVERAVIVGGGRVAERKARTLVDLGVDVIVVAPEESEWIRDLPVRFVRRKVKGPEDLPEADLYVVATDDPDLNARLERALSLVNRVDTPRPKVRFPSVLRSGDAVLAISTGKPRVTKALRMIAAELLGPTLRKAAELSEDARKWSLERVINELEGLRWQDQ